MTLRQLAPLLAVLVAVAACDKAKPPPAPAEPQAQAQAPVANGPPERPPLPDWSHQLVGLDFAGAFPRQMKCQGAVEGLTARYADARAVVGWGWNETGGKPIGQVVAVNRKGFLVGYGDGGQARPDVRQKAPQVTSDAVGWTLVTGAPAPNGVRIFGVDLDKHAACLLGETTVPLS